MSERSVIPEDETDVAKFIRIYRASGFEAAKQQLGATRTDKGVRWETKDRQEIEMFITDDGELR